MYAYPIDSVVTYAEDGTPHYDRAVDSSQLRELYHSLMTDGVLLNDSSKLQVSASANMDIVVNPGLCNIQGCIKKFSEETPITIASANATMSRIDTVVARLDLNSDYRDIGLFVIQGIPASVPTRPELTRNTSVYEIALADITISANATSLTQANISDTRLDTNRCGIISAIAQFDTTKLYEQIQADLTQFQQSNESEFEQWFEHMKEQLGEDAAGNLQLQIDDHTEQSVPSENGAHGFRYFEGKLQAHIYDEESMTLKWVTVPGSGIAYDNEKSVQGAIDEVSEYVGITKINHIPYPYSEGTKTVNGITWTVNNDGTIIGNGTANGTTFCTILATNNKIRFDGDFILNGCPKIEGVYLGVDAKTLNSNYVDILVERASDTGDGVSFNFSDVEYTQTAVFIRVESGTTLNNAVFKPMIRPSYIEDNTYVPYVADVQTQINALETQLGNISELNLSQTLTETSKPWKEIQAQINKFTLGKIYHGSIHSGATYTYQGYIYGTSSSKYGNFIISNYSSFYFMTIQANTCYLHNLITSNSNGTQF